METQQSRIFANQLYIAVHGESMDDFEARIKKESDEKRLLDNVASIQKMLRLGKLSIAEIANILDVSEDFVQEVQSRME